MTISSSLESFSLPELFKLIEREKKSGRLIVQSSVNDSETKCYIWFQDGYLVAISDRLNCKGLIDFIQCRGFLSPVVASKLRTLCPPQEPLGVYLHKKGLLTKERLSLIFQLQLDRVYELFQLRSGSFQFDEVFELENRLLTIPWLEMTGHRMKATQITMYALRMVNNWDYFVEEFPDPNFCLSRLKENLDIRLLTIELQVWNKADGSTTVKDIAEELGDPLITIQAIAFRLIMVGLVDEVFIPSYAYSGNRKKDVTAIINSPVSSITKINPNKERYSYQSLVRGFRRLFSGNRLFERN